VLVMLIFSAAAITIVSVSRDDRFPPFGVSTDEQALFNGLVAVSRLQRSGMPETNPERRALEIYLAARYAPLSSRPASFGGALRPFRQLTTEIAARHPTISDPEMLLALRQLGPDRLDELNSKQPGDYFVGLLLPVASAWLWILTGIGVLSLALAFIARGGLIARLFGTAVVTDDGREVTRLRALGRAGIGWSPIIALQLLPQPASMAFEAHAAFNWLLAAAACSAMVMGTCWSVIEPGRGLHDRLAGTWLVPR
jgi:uncharacterized RDD family membrane protein YckC